MATQEPVKRGRGRPPKKRGPPQEPAKTTVSVGNCRVAFPASLGSCSDAEGLCINISDACSISVKVAKESPIAPSGFTFTLLNPKNLDGVGKQLLQDVHKLYTQELPAMKYAANTGKESRFLENCIFGGKYCTLILRNAQLELFGAMTYQMLPTDTNQAELPLCAVAQAHHRKGFGACLYKELQRRLFDVGVLSIFCWGDQESEAFWAKQGFVTVAEVDGRGKPWKLPIKADVRRAMSIPGSATLMISYLSSLTIQTASPGPRALAVTSNDMTSGDIPGKPSLEISKTAVEKFSPSLNSRRTNGEMGGQELSPISVPTPQNGEIKSSHINTTTPGQVVGESASLQQNFRPCITPLNMEGMFTTIASEDPKGNVSKPPEPGLDVETRLPLADATNSSPALNAGNRPLKKRPVPRSTPKESSVTTEKVITTVDIEKENVAKMELKEDNSTSSPPRRIGRRRGGVPEVPPKLPRAAQTEVALDKNNVKAASKSGMTCGLIPAVSPEEKTGGKRGRETGVLLSTSTRRSTRRRMAEDTADRENELTEKRKNEDVVKEMLDLLVSQQATDAVLAEKSEKKDNTESDRGATGTGNIAKSADLPNPETDIERQNPSTTEAEPTGRSTDAPGCHENCQVESGGFQGAKKRRPEETSSCGAAEQSLTTSPVIMFMNMADEKKKKQLIKYVERLLGTVTSDGCKCTHVVTGEVRRTLNFCVAISSGAWILSPDWLKTSVRQKSFADEARFVLRDRKFEAKYKLNLEDVIRRAKERPNLLLSGMYLYLTPHIHPPVETISQIVEAAGGKVLKSLEDALQLEAKSHAVAVATEDDMSDALSAAKGGLRTFSSDWLLTCIVKQELDLTATQFSESL